MLAGIYYRQNKLDTLIAYAAPIVNKTNLESSEQIHLLLAEAYYENKIMRKRLFITWALYPLTKESFLEISNTRLG